MVADLDRSTAFYSGAFGMHEVFRDGDDLVFMTTPGRHDSLALHLSARRGARRDTTTTLLRNRTDRAIDIAFGREAER